MSLRINGMDKLLSKLEELDKKVQNKISDTDLNKAGEIVKNSVISKAPVKTGKLKGSIEKGKITGTGAKRQIKIGNLNGDMEVSRYFYYQENGTSKMVGKKFLKNGFLDSVQDANNCIVETLKEGLK